MRYLVVRRDDYLAHHGVKGQKWGIRNRSKFNRGKKLYERGKTISTNADKREQLNRAVSITANIATAAAPIALFAAANSYTAKTSSNPIIRAASNMPMWAIPISGGVANLGIRFVGRLLETPYDIQDSDMRYYYNRRSQE